MRPTLPKEAGSPAPEPGGSSAAPRPPAHPFLRIAAPVSAAWVGLSGAHLALSRIFEGSASPEAWSPAWLQLGLIGTELMLAALTLVSVALLLLPLGRLERRFPRPPALLLSTGVRILVVAAFVFAYAVSWISFSQLGHFADVQGLEFAWVNGGQFFAYVQATHPALLWAGPIASLALAAASVLLGPRLLGLLPDAVIRRGVRLILGIAGVCLLGTLAVTLFHGYAEEGVKDPLTGITHSWGRLYECRRSASAGPFSHGYVALLRSAMGSPSLPEVRLSSSSKLQRRPQLRMEDYAAAVDRKIFRPYNVVIVLVDSLRPDYLSAGGAVRPVMRRMDELSREGRFFSDARTEASHTDYASLCPLTGQYPLRSRTTHRYPEHPPYPRVLIYDVLKSLGYRTALVSSQDEHWGLMINYLNTGGLDRIDHAYDPSSRSMLRNFRRDDLTVDAAIRWISEDPQKPFFLYLNLQNSHFPYVVPATWPRRFGRPADFPMTMGLYPRERVPDVINLYADALDYQDAQIGRLVDSLKEKDRWSGTIFVLVADHGEAFMEHGFAGHASALFEEVMKVPLLLVGPGVGPGIDRRPAELIDVPSTVCHVLGIPPHPSFQGRDLFAADFPTERSRFMVAHTPLATQYAVERGGWKLIVDEPLALEALYDLRTDPRETRDVSGDQASILEELRRQCAEWRYLQLEYYRNPDRMAKEYPPYIAESQTK